MMSHAEGLEPALEIAARCLTRSWGDEVRLRNAATIKDGGRCRVIRCEAVRGGSATSVILKQAKGNTADSLVFADWASLAFLATLPRMAEIVPRFLGGDAGAALFAMADLGEGETLEDALNGDDPEGLRRLFLRWATATARLQAGTQNGEEAFLRQARSLSPSALHDRRQGAESWLAARPGLLDWLQATGLSPPDGFEQSLRRIARAFAEPGPWLAFTHGDPAPTNAHVARGKVRLVDFEYGGFRHALYDLTGWYALCPLPLSLVREMSSRYREHLASSFAPARDEAAFQEAWAMLCSYRALAMLTWVSPGVITEDAPWVAEWSRRSAVLCATSRLRFAANGLGELAPVAEYADRLEKRLRALWPDLADQLPAWPALRKPACTPREEVST
jgi:hypothetical protein